MSISTADIKLLKSQRLSDEADGGGRATGEAVVSDQVNNVFPDISRLARTTGNISLRKLYGGPVTQNSDPWLGAHAIVGDDPADPRVSVLLFNTGSSTDQRAAARDAIESYVAAATPASFDLLGTQLAGQRAIACVQREEQSVPEVGDVFQLITPTHAQYVRLTAVEQRLETFVYDFGSGSFSSFIRRRLDMSISAPLLYEFPGGSPTPAGTSPATDGKAKARVLGTQVADAARYYGISRLAQAVAMGALSLSVDSVYSQLVPSTTKETALVDQLAGYQRQAFIAAGPARSVALTTAATSTAGECRTYLGTGCAPGSLSITANGGTFADNSRGGLRHVSGANWISAGTVDYQTGEITMTRAGSAFVGSANASYRPGAAALGEAITDGIEITLASRGYVYTLSLSDALPRPGTLSVSYMALGRWYELRDLGAGLLVGEGAGTIDFTTGSVSITLNALPDVNSALVYSYISSADGDIKSHSGTSVVPRVEVRHTLPDQDVMPGSVTVTFAAGTVRTLSDNGGGQLSGSGGTGTISYATGEIVMQLSATPVGVIDYAYEIGDPGGAVGGPIPATIDGTGVTTFTVPGAPLTPGSVRAEWMTSRRQPVPAGVQGLTALPVYNGTVEMSWSAQDDGAGGWTGPDGALIGTIDYATGACSLQVARLYDYTEYNYAKRQDGNKPWMKLAVFKTNVQVRESFGGTMNIRAMADAITTEVGSSSTTAPELTIQLLPGMQGAIIPGSLLFTWNGETYTDRSGTLYKNVNSTTNAGLAVGVVDYAGRSVVLNAYAGNVGGVVSILACLTSVTGYSVSQVTFRTSGAPLRAGSMQLTVVRTDTAAIVTATSDANGYFATGIVHGRVDAATGIARLRFTSDPDDETGASDVPVIPLLTRYNAVVQTRLPLDAGLLGLDPVRLPADGRVPIYREGDVLVIHHTAETVVPSPVPGGTLTLDRGNVAEIRVVGANGAVLRAPSFSADREAGALTWANPLVLQDEEGGPVTQPLLVRDRVEHMTLCTEVQITGELGISSPVPWTLPAGTRVSSALTWGDLRSRLHNWFTQQTWNQGAPNWTDAPIGNTTTAQYNSLSYPQVITNAGGIDGRWALVFTSSTAFNVVEQQLGVIATGSTTADCSPINALTGQPYFTIKKEGWGSGWAAANAVRFNTDSALGSMWVVRTVLAGQGTVDDDRIELLVRGDAD
ncbi:MULTISPECIES: hypothetical protein [unclassified Pseudomonas]|uniref:hypothetical protein n=1 Tax=unclassified Pseudomonas TaxID=196821 RepID=UPI002449F5EF|nr:MULTISPECIES: hypothetical protein [unclassified Pseudomonas]MDG9928255.1 hypothetical protein [Pseudomonas sp. GD04042]MDH0481181.1 hypothetical protein [Pseudomonas sp. GD04015]MDH0604517.1 hypothetical protein [Pseudomonas sp. GD03869]